MRILVVDDDSDLRVALMDVLRLSGFQVAGAASGAEAISILKAGERFDLILSDYFMRNGNGLGILKYLQSTNEPHPAFFLMTGHSEVRSEEALSMGVDEFILKPFDVMELLSAIKRL